MIPLSTGIMTATFLLSRVPTAQPTWTLEPKHAVSTSKPVQRTSSYSLLGGDELSNYAPQTDAAIAILNNILNDVDAVASLCDELDGYLSLHPGWDGELSIPPSRETVDRAKHLLKLLPPGIPLPKPMLSANGEVGLYWNTQTAYADFGFESNGTNSFYLRKKIDDQSEAFIDNIDVANLDLHWIREHLGILNDRQMKAA